MSYIENQNLEFYLVWKMVDKDFVAKYEDKIFRIKYQVKQDGKYYSLQVRQVKSVNFQEIGYAFYTNDNYSSSKYRDKSYKGIKWDDELEILIESEKILLDTFYIEKTSSFPYSNEEIIKYFKKKYPQKYDKNYEDPLKKLLSEEWGTLSMNDD